MTQPAGKEPNNFHQLLKLTELEHCVKSARIRSYCGPYFLAFELNSPNFSHHSECGKMWTRITPNTDTFHAVETISTT